MDEIYKKLFCDVFGQGFLGVMIFMDLWLHSDLQSEY